MSQPVGIKSWVETQLGQLTQTGQRDIPHHRNWVKLVRQDRHQSAGGEQLYLDHLFLMGFYFFF